MPTVSNFHGITVALYANDHNPPHFHAFYGEHEVLVEIVTLTVLKGSFPTRPLKLLMKWAAIHQAALQNGWNLLRAGALPPSIPPLP